MPEETSPERYQLREPLGAGGMGEVYRAWDSVLQRDVAVKLLRAGMPEDSHGRARLLREARMAATLSHPSICVVHDVGESNGRPFVTMELLPGETLRRRLRREKGLPFADAARIGRQVAAALSAAHERGIVHRDIKPENIMLLPDGRVKVLDFGLAKPMGDSQGAVSTSGESPSNVSQISTRLHEETLGIAETSLTAPGAIVGTSHYLSPEQIQARPADSRSDVFAFGVVLYEMLAGKHPFTGRTYPELIASILKDDPPSAAAIRPGTPAALNAVVLRCLKKDPQERFADGAELTKTLDQIPLPDARRRTLPWALTAALLVAVGLAAAAGWQMMKTTAALKGAKGRGAALPTLKRLTFDGSSSFPYFSPDGTMLAFASAAGVDWQAMIMPIGGGTPRQLTNFKDGFVPMGWGAKGDTLLGLRGSGAWDTPLWELPISGGEPRVLLEKGIFPDFAPDRRHLAYSTSRNAQSAGDIRIRDMETGEERVIYAFKVGEEACWCPRWSPDGDWLMYKCLAKGPFTNNYNLYRVRPDGSERTQIPLPSGLRPNLYYQWAADGQSILTGAYRDLRLSLFLIPAFGQGDLRRLTVDYTGDDSPTMDRAGRRIVFRRSTTTKDLLEVGVDGVSRHQVFSTQAEAGTPAFDPDGTGIFFTHIVNGVGIINWLPLPISGHGSTPLTDESSLSCLWPVPLGGGVVAFACKQVSPSPQEAANAVQEARTIWIADRSGGSPTPLFTDEGSDGIVLVTASPSGRHILYDSATREGHALRLYDRATNQSRDLLRPKRGESYKVAAWTRSEDVLRMIHRTWAVDGRVEAERPDRIEEISISTGRVSTLGEIPDGAKSSILSRGGEFVAYATGDPRQIWLRSVEGSRPPRKVAEMADNEDVGMLALSPDARTVVITRIISTSDLYLLENF
ncbi:MAG: serine/threonine-protein kinase [Acidobacteria bacterium]|nr:serine/threonine-protein kinase [Acidobacteriota bacterium]